MNPRRRTLWWPCLACSVVLAAACGKKGPPLAPLQLTPARVEELTVRRLGDKVYLRFPVPQQNSDGKSPADIRSVDVLALTGEPVDLAGKSLDARSLAEEATLVASVEVQPPPVPESVEDRQKREKAEAERAQRGLPPLPAPPPDPRPKQGDTVSVVETLTPAMLTPYVPRLGKALPPRKPTAVADQTPMPVMAPEILPLRRVYVAAGRSKKGRLGGLSPRVGVPLTDVPPVPPAPTLTYTEQGIAVSWTPPAAARLPVQAEAEPGSLPVKLLFPVGIPHTYNVYDPGGAASGTSPATMPVPLNATPLPVPAFVDSRLQFGVERCYVVRTVEAAGAATIESDPSPPACVTPVDTFPPAPPSSLAAVGSEGAINLIWEPTAATDLAGYIVLRGTPDGGALQAITPSPIRETTYRDVAVRSGRRYVYAVVAVDSATPPNVSAESNRVEETAR